MNRLTKYIIVGFLILIVSFWFYQNREKGNPIENFNAFFNVFKEKYANFETKGIDWQETYNFYSKRVNEKTTNEELFNIFQEFLSKLNDKHCYIYRFNQIYFSGFNLPSLNYLDLLSFDFRVKTNDFSLKLIETEYISSSKEKSLRVYSFLPPIGTRNIFTTGWLKDSIAYIHMTEMSPKSKEVHNSIADFYDKYRNAKGFVIDIRDNIGGYSTPVKELAEIFADKEHLYAISRLRNSDSSLSFQEPDYWTIKPNKEKNILNKPIALLVNKNTQSAAELFTLMMKTIPTVKVIGNVTSGIFADTHTGKLPNGWEYRLSIRKTNNSNDISLEGIGIIPDTLIVENKKFIEKNKDNMLECAIEYILSYKMN